MMNSLTGYIASKKENCHPDTLGILDSLAARFDDLKSRKDVDKAELASTIEKRNCTVQAASNAPLPPGRQCRRMT